MALNTDLKFYLENLKSDECMCGKEKRPNYSFCYKCYSALPKDMKDPLWKKIGSGYEKGFEEAFIHLQSEVWI